MSAPVTTLNENTRTPLDGTEWIRLATPGANWKGQTGGQMWVFQGISGGSSPGSALTLQSTTAIGSGDMILFQVGSQLEAMRIDGLNGVVCITMKGGALSGPSGTSPLQILGNGVNSGLISANEYNSVQALISLTTTGSSVNANSQGAITNGTGTGGIRFKGSDGTSFANSSSISGAADADFSTGSFPGRLSLSTTPSGSNALVERVRTDSVGLTSFTNTNGFGYGLAGNGDGGTVTQGSSRTTAVTLNTVSGAITLFTAAPTVGTWVSFTVNNTKVAASDVILVSIQSGTNTYVAVVSAVASNSFRISFMSIAGTSSDAPVINFNVVKGITS